MTESLWPQKIWSQEELANEFPYCKNLGDLISATEVLAKQENLVVCEVRANGMRLTENQELTYKNTLVSELKTFEVRVQKVDALLDESLAGCYDYLLKLSDSMEVAATLFRSEDINAAHKYYKRCIEGTELFIEMITHYKIVYKNSHKNTDTNIVFNWKSHEDNLLNTLGQILDAYKKKNFILVADLLEYDLITVLTVWRDELIKLEKYNQRDTDSGPISEIQT